MTEPTGPLEFNVEDRRWTAAGLEATCQNAARSALRHLNFVPERVIISVLLAGEDRIAALNAEFRGKPVPTNVLSWPAEELGPRDDGQPPRPPQPDPDGLYEPGDIAMCYDTCAREALEQQKTMADHVSHLTVHGILHLLGYDHIRDGDAALMEDIEVEILEELGLADPYCENPVGED